MLPWIDLLGYWLAIFLTFAILSFLYKDNPFYKFAEHLFIGVSVGYIVVRQYVDVLKPKLIDNLAKSGDFSEQGEGGVLELMIWIVPLILVALMFAKISKRWSWLGRYPLAFVVGLFAGMQVNNVPQSDLIKQVGASTGSFEAKKVDVNKAGVKELVTVPGLGAVREQLVKHRETKPFTSLDELRDMEGLSDGQRQALDDSRGPLRGLDARASVHPDQTDWFGTLSNLLLLLGLLASLVYFYFSIEHKGAIGGVSRFGVWVLMIGFGASFGLTVQGRVSLAIGRALDILGDNKSPEIAEQIHGPWVALASVLALVIGLAVWERRQRDKDEG
jgi:hypothetical protein